MLYVYGEIPPLPVAVIVPVLAEQEEAVVTAVTAGALLLVTVADTVLVQPVLSLMVMVYTPAASPKKKLLAW